MPRSLQRPSPEELGALDQWEIDPSGQAISRSLCFDDFTDAFAFMTRVALLAERLDHHPDWRNVYKQLDIRLSTHDVGGLTTLDLQMAQAIDRWFAQYHQGR